jgi:hypothetical protein
VPAGEYRAKLTVQVLDEKGAPVEGATVDLGGARSGRGMTNGAGVTAWGGLHIGRYTVSARKEGYTPEATRREISVPGTDEIVIKLTKGYRLEVRVFREGGKPAASEICLAVPLSQGAGRRGTLRIQKGRGRLERLDKGHYLVMAAGGKGKGTVFERDRGGSVVDVGRITMVGIRLGKVYPVRIELTAAKGKKVPAKPLFALVSPEARDLLPDTGDKVMLAAAAYMVYLRMGPKQYVLLGRRTVTGPDTLKLDLKGVNLDKANWVSEEEVLRLLLPKAGRVRTRPMRNQPSTRASK